MYHDVEAVRPDSGVTLVEAHSLEDPLLALQYHTSSTTVESEIIQDNSAVEPAWIRVIESNRNTSMTGGEVWHVEDIVSQLRGLTNRPVDVTNRGGLINIGGVDDKILDYDVEVVVFRLNRIFGKDVVVIWEIRYGLKGRRICRVTD